MYLEDEELGHVMIMRAYKEVKGIHEAIPRKKRGIPWETWSEEERIRQMTKQGEGCKVSMAPSAGKPALLYLHN